MNKKELKMKANINIKKINDNYNWMSTIFMIIIIICIIASFVFNDNKDIKAICLIISPFLYGFYLYYLIKSIGYSFILKEMKKVDNNKTVQHEQFEIEKIKIKKHLIAKGVNIVSAVVIEYKINGIINKGYYVPDYKIFDEMIPNFKNDILNCGKITIYENTKIIKSIE